MRVGDDDDGDVKKSAFNSLYDMFNANACISFQNEENKRKNKRRRKNKNGLSRELEEEKRQYWIKNHIDTSVTLEYFVSLCSGNPHVSKFDSESMSKFALYILDSIYDDHYDHLKPKNTVFIDKEEFSKHFNSSVRLEKNRMSAQRARDRRRTTDEKITHLRITMDKNQRYINGMLESVFEALGAIINKLDAIESNQNRPSACICDISESDSSSYSDCCDILSYVSD